MVAERPDLAVVRLEPMSGGPQTRSWIRSRRSCRCRRTRRRPRWPGADALAYTVSSSAQRVVSVLTAAAEGTATIR